MNYKIITNTIGWVLNVEAAALILPLICAIVYGEPEYITFIICILICGVLGAALTFPSIKNRTMFSKEGFITVALSWIVMSIFGALPFVFSGAIPNFIDAVFETVSGFTTTGASILTDVESLPKSILFWRSFTHFIGGMGVLVFLVAILPLSGGNNLYLIKAESPGPSVSKLVPKIKSTAKILYLIYIFLTLLEVVLLYLGGLDMFSSLTLSFGTAGTGGFGVLNTSIGSYSPYIQNVITVFMILFGIDFSVYYMLLLGKFRSVLRSEELRAYLGIILFSIIVLTINIYPHFKTLSETVRHASFQTAALMTTTGYSTYDFDIWPEFSKTVLVTLMFIGASAGSTGGGIKVSRIMIFVKSIFKEIKIAAHPKSTHKVTMNGRPVEHTVIRAVNVYMAAYIVIYVVSILIVSLDGMDYTTNFTSVVATLNNIGPGLAKVGPTQNFSIFSPLSKIILSMDMLIGRLEIFPILVLFSPSAWRK